VGKKGRWGATLETHLTAKGKSTQRELCGERFQEQVKGNLSGTTSPGGQRRAGGVGGEKALKRRSGKKKSRQLHSVQLPPCPARRLQGKRGAANPKRKKKNEQEKKRNDPGAADWREGDGKGIGSERDRRGKWRARRWYKVVTGLGYEKQKGRAR